MLILLVAQNAANTFFYNNENAANTTPVVGYLHAYNISGAHDILVHHILNLIHQF
jgi:hypothetical protein